MVCSRVSLQSCNSERVEAAVLFFLQGVVVKCGHCSGKVWSLFW